MRYWGSRAANWSASADDALPGGVAALLSAPCIDVPNVCFRERDMVAMPPPDTAVLSRREAIIAGLRRIIPGEGTIQTEKEMRVYETDGLTAYRQLPLA